MFRKAGRHLSDEPLVTIATFETSFEASLARGALEAIGIRALVAGEMLGSLSMQRVGLPVTQLRVFASQRARAQVELRRLTMRLVEPPDTPDER